MLAAINNNNNMTENISNKITELQRLLNKLQLTSGVSTHQLARNQFPMHKLVMAALMLHNPKKALFPNRGLTRNEIVTEISKLGQRVTSQFVSATLDTLQKQRKVKGLYYSDTGKSYVWQIVK